MKCAIVTRIGEIVTVSTPDYDALFVTEIKRIPGRKWSGPPLKLWSIPAQYEEYARVVVRKYFPIEDEPGIEIEGAPEPLEGPFAVLKLEFIAENYYAYKRQATILHEGTERYKEYLGRNQSRPWVKRLTKKGGHLEREFMNGQIDYSQANRTGSRGVYLYFYLPAGVYEINERCSWTRVRRYYCRVERGQIIEIEQEEVETWLSEKESRE
jgi:hypothetical protein